MLKISYYKFELRSYSKYCNGVETFYTYDPQRRRLQNLAVISSSGTIMDNAYSYDAVSNVLSIANATPLPQSGKAGGQMSHTYGYDALYRLTSASGTYRGADNKSASYTLAMSYDNMHRIKSKSQHLTQQGVQFDGTLNAGFDLTYTYQDSLGHKFQLSKIEDLNYRTEGTPKEKIDNGHRYLYDANGNLVYINTSRVKKDGKEDEQAVEKKYRWDEENRLLASDENGFVANYWYDADGERTVKSSGEGEQIYVNSEFSGGVTNTAKFSLYVSPYLVASQGGKYTKHIYIGSQRIVSKLGDLASYGADPRRIPYAGTEADGVSVDYQTKYNRQQQAIKDNYADFGVPYNGEDNNDYVNGEGFCCNDGTPTVARAKAARSIEGNFKPNDDYEKMQFYYHPDHLGSSSYITNLDGEVVQHIEYVPFGEVFIEERNNTWNTPYLFNAKEYDEETGMYYYGARYYEPKISLWMSTDKEQEKYPNISSYCYSLNAPSNYIDPNGELVIFINGMYFNPFEGGHPAYWNGLDKTIAGILNDYHIKYFDGATGGILNTLTKGVIVSNLNPYARMLEGLKMGLISAQSLISSLKNGEKIRIVTHSMGAAYGKGFIKGLIKYGELNGIDVRDLIDFELDLAPFQPTYQSAVEGVNTVVIAHRYDNTAGSSPMPNAQNNVTRTDEQFKTNSFIKEHSVKSFTHSELETYIPNSQEKRGNKNRKQKRK